MHTGNEALSGTLQLFWYLHDHTN